MASEEIKDLDVQLVVERQVIELQIENIVENKSKDTDALIKTVSKYQQKIKNTE